MIEFVPLGDLAKIPPVRYLHDTKFIDRGFNIVFGPSGAFKSFYALDVAMRIPAPVVYIAGEGAGGLHKRAMAWCAYNGEPASELYFVCHEINLLNVAQVNALIEGAESIKPALVIFDTLARCIPGADENSAKDVGLAVNHSTMIQRKADCSIAWLHHTNRADRGERGSGAMRGAADTMIELSANGDGIIRVSCSKLKDEEYWPTEELRFHKVGDSGVLVPRGILDDHEKLSVSEMQILEFLSLEVFETAGAQARQIVSSVNIPERNIYRMLSHLKRELHISQDRKGDPYFLTDKGKSLVCKSTAKSGSVISLVKSIN